MTSPQAKKEGESSPPGPVPEEVAGPSGIASTRQLSVTALAASPASSLEALSPSPGPSRECRTPNDEDALMKVETAKGKLLVFLSQSKTLCDTMRRRTTISRDLLERAVRQLLSNTQPFFNNLESSARNTASQHLPVEICAKLLKISQQLCDSVEQLLLECASRKVISVDESDPLGVSHFCIGSCLLGQLRVTSFRYCKLSPYSVQVNMRLLKRMRWNVDRLREAPQRQQKKRDSDEQQQEQNKKKDESGDQKKKDKSDKQPKKKDESDEQQPEETVRETEFYFLCYEDPIKEGGKQTSKGNATGLWSIGRWVQVFPDPNTETLFDWLLCEVPRGKYLKLLDLGREEPSSSSATDYMHQLLTTLEVDSDS